MINCWKKGVFLTTTKNVTKTLTCTSQPFLFQSQLGQRDRRRSAKAAEQRRHPERVPKQAAAESEKPKREKVGVIFSACVCVCVCRSSFCPS